jgi:hypothetical protein
VSTTAIQEVLMRRVRLLFTLCFLAGALSAGIAVAPSAGAYGKTSQYQVAVSLNCDSTVPGACDDFGGTGGFWAWYVFNNDGTGDATLTGCSHVVAAGGKGLAGAGHANVEILQWTTGPAIPPDDPFPGPNFYIVHDETTFVGHGTPQTLADQFVGDTGVPTTPGHYNLHLAPGIQAQVTVVLIPNR